ncbi:hypothetical protein FRC01_001495, partial [Tulasnella sp. 417]
MSSTPPATASGQPPPQSNAQLAVLLAQAYQDIETLRTERDNALHRADNAQALFAATTSAASGPGASGAPSNDAAATITALQTVNESQLRTIADLTARLKVIAENWGAYERWCAGIDVRTADARLALARSINGLTNTSDNDAIASASSPLPFKDILPFPNPSVSRRPSRATLSSHPALQIPPGAPGGRPTSSAGVPSNLPPIPSGVVAGRIRPRDSSIPRRRSDDEPGSATFRRDPLDPTAAEERPHRQSTDDTDSTGDAVEGERQRKRIRADAGPAALSTSAAPNIARRDRARFNESDSFSMNSPYPRHAHRYSRSSGDIRADMRADSMGDGIMGGPRTDSPPPIDSGRRFPFERQDSSMSVEGRDKDRSLGMPRQELERRARQTADEGDHERMDVDGNVDPRLAEGDQGRIGRASVGRRGRPAGTMEDDERDSVEEFLTTAISPAGDDDRAGRGGDGEERDELQEDREMSPMSTQAAIRAQSHSGQMERWRAVDRERELRQREDEQRGDSGSQMQYANSNGLVKIKSDQFRYYSTPDQLKQHSPSTSPHLSSSHPQPHHGSTYPPPAFQTLAMQHGQLQQIRRGTIAGIVTTPNPRDELAYQARASYSGPSHSRRPSGENGPPSSGLSHPSLVGPPSAGGPLSAGGSGTHIIYPHSQQPRHTGPGPAVKPTLNAQGQRTCRQCGQPGRYKDGKCVEKWGPGPAGPGTVCDRCRKKMKRVERRGTQDAGSLGQQIPLQALSSAQQQQPQLSPRQYYGPQSQSSYPRDGQQYSPSDVPTPAREFQFQPPLSASSTTWAARGSKDWSNEQPRHGRTGSITTSPTSQQPKSNQPASAKPREKRRAPTYSPSPSPAQGDEGRSSKSASQPRSAEDDAAASNAGSSQQRKNSGDSQRSEMESAAEVLEVALVDDGAEVISPAATAKDKDGEDDADGDGDMEDAVGEEEDADAEPSANAASATGPDSDQGSRHSASLVQSPAPQPISRKTPISRHSTSTPNPIKEKDSLKP